MKSPRSIFIDESADPGALAVLTRIKSFTEIRNGIYTTLERLQLRYPGVRYYYKHFDPLFQSSFLSKNKKWLAYNGEKTDLSILPEQYLPWQLIANVDKVIQEDLVLWKKTNKKKYSGRLPVGVQGRGKKKDRYIHKDADVFPGVVIDTTLGPVIIDSGAVIKPFTYLEGPVYIGQDAKVDNAKVGGGTVVGHLCRIGGEVENSIIGDFSNKHHEGFLGHSIVGNWVNIGAMATTSDLKNNYGIVKISIGTRQFGTETIKFGSLIGDYVKIAIGVMLNTGTVIDIGCNVFSNRVNGYLPPFLWAEGNDRYRLDKFIQDTKTIMSRRSRDLSNEEEELIRSIFVKL